MKLKRNIRRMLPVLGLLVFPFFLTAGEGEDNTALNFRFLLQPWIQLTGGGAPDGVSLGRDAYLKRTRIILSGRIHEKIAFFAETDIPNWGKNGSWSSEFILQDAFIDLTLTEARGPIDRINLAFGMILLPFSRHNRQSAASLNTLNYRAGLIRFPEGSHKSWRDSRIEVRGLFFGERVDARMGLFNGSRGEGAAGREINPRDLPRWTGRIQLNLLESEQGFFYGGNHLGKKSIFSLGMGIDFQPDAHATGRSGSACADHLGISADLFLDQPLAGDRELVVQAGYFLYDHGRESRYGAPFFSKSGKALGLEAGFRFGKISQSAAGDQLLAGGP